MPLEVTVTIKFDDNIVDILSEMCEEVIGYTDNEIFEKWIGISKERFSIHNERFKDEDVVSHPHGFYVYVSKKKLPDNREPFIMFRASYKFIDEREHSKDTIRDLTKWINENLPTAKIVSAEGWNGTYRYENGKYVLVEGASFSGKLIEDEIKID